MFGFVASLALVLLVASLALVLLVAALAALVVILAAVEKISALFAARKAACWNCQEPYEAATGRCPGCGVVRNKPWRCGYGHLHAAGEKCPATKSTERA